MRFNNPGPEMEFHSMGDIVQESFPQVREHCLYTRDIPPEKILTREKICFFPTFKFKIIAKQHKLFSDCHLTLGYKEQVPIAEVCVPQPGFTDVIHTPHLG